MSVLEVTTRTPPRVALEDVWSNSLAREFFLRVWPMYVHDISAFDSDFYRLDPSGRWLPDIGGDWVAATTSAQNIHEGRARDASEQPFQRAHVITEDGRAVGFACIGLSPFRYMPADADIVLAELFLIHRGRGRGIATAAVRLLVARYPGRWSLSAIHDNVRAVQFWRATLPLLDLRELRERVVERDFVWDFVVPT